MIFAQSYKTAYRRIAYSSFETKSLTMRVYAS